MRKIILLLSLTLATSLFAQDLKDVAYTENKDDYAQKRCKLDVYNIDKDKQKPILVWFHGGGIRGGDKLHLLTGMKSKSNGFVLVSVNYRLSPKIKAWEAIDDCAEAVAWVYKNAEKLGGNKDAIFVGGHSAGGYLSGMLTFAPKYLQKYNIKNTELAGAILLSAQVTKHFQVRKDGGDETNSLIPIIDELAILGNVQNKVPPICIIVGDRRLEWKCRVEENILLEATVRHLKTSPFIQFFELQGLTHGSVASGLTPIAKQFIKDVVKLNASKK